MAPRKRQFILVSVMLAMLVIAAAWSIHWMLGQREVATLAADDLAACQSLAREIRQLRQKPSIAAASEIGGQELGARIEEASRLAQLSPTVLEGVFPQASRRLGDSPYLHKPTALALRGVSTMQLVTFLYHLTDHGGLSVHDLRLRTPRGDSTGKLWDAEATVTCLVYSPPAQDAPRSQR